MRSIETGGLFPGDAVIRRVDGESVLLLGGGRALLMQLAHPLVAAAVAEHSGFQADPLARLQRTLETSFVIVFGTTEQAHAAAAGVRSVHERVFGEGYRADDPTLLLWVHATLVDTALRVHQRFLQPLRPADAERYYEESTVVAELLGVPRAAQPSDLAQFRDYVRACVASLEVSDTAAASRATCCTHACRGRSRPWPSSGARSPRGCSPRHCATSTA